MGAPFLLNIADHSFSVIGFDKEITKVESLEKVIIQPRAKVTNLLLEFISCLKKPRSIILLVPSAVVDSVIDELLPIISPGDLIVDAGNSYFKETNRREKLLVSKKISFLGMGVSGGQSGARFGPSLMPGGDFLSYKRLQPILLAVAAQVNGEPCVGYMGPSSAGHFVKMVHNGIEYGIMQLIAETYHLLKSGLHLSDEECHEVYEEWNKKKLNSYLIEITAKIFLKKDDQTEKPLIDFILDVAKQKGSGMWTSHEAMELHVPTPTIDAAVSARNLSLYKKERERVGANIKNDHGNFKVDKKTFIQQLEDAYFISSLITFSQGMALLFKASKNYEYDFNLENIIRVWRGGCIIRASYLETILSTFKRSPDLSNLLLDPHLQMEFKNKAQSLRFIIANSLQLEIPVPAFMASLAYFDGYCSQWLPANLIEAQRDYFGAHTYERIGEQGNFHTEWDH